MRLTDIDGRAIRQALANSAREFHTRQVSDQQLMLDAHRLREPSYHSLVGRYLSRHRAALDLELLQPHAGVLGARWRKQP